MNRTIGVVLAAIVLLALLAYGGARYLVGKLDGSGPFAPAENLRTLSSEHIGLAFSYPDRYIATTTHEGNAERTWHAITLLPAGYEPPLGGEGPPTIHVQEVPNPEGLPLEQWIRGDNRSNFKLSSDGSLAQTTVGGEPALAYRYSGLYENDAVAVAHGAKVFVFSAGWLAPEDRIRTDFAYLLDTVVFLSPESAQ